MKWIVQIEVDKAWVADGFDLHAGNVHERMRQLLPHAFGYEMKAKVLAAPDERKIAKAQGYPTIKEYKKARKWS